MMMYMVMLVLLERKEQSTFHYVHLKILLYSAYPICTCIDYWMILLTMEMMAVALLALEVVVRVSCSIVAAFEDADIVVGESKRGEVDMDYVDDDGVSNDD